MCKVYSLDTFRELTKKYNTDKESALKQSVINSQENLETHLKNIEFLSYQNKSLDNTMEIV